MSRAIGIDLGTTYSLAAVVESGRLQALELGGQTLIPSVIGLSEAGEILVGQTALNQYVLAPERTIRSVKRKMGSRERIALGDASYLPEEISSFILKYVKELAAEALG